MPTSVALGSHFESFVKSQVASGRYNNASEVVREGLRLLQDHEEVRRMRLDALRAEIQRGLDSGSATPFDINEVRDEGKRLRARRRSEGQG